MAFSFLGLILGGFVATMTPKPPEAIHLTRGIATTITTVFCNEETDAESMVRIWQKGGIVEWNNAINRLADSDKCLQVKMDGIPQRTMKDFGPLKLGLQHGNGYVVEFQMTAFYNAGNSRIESSSIMYLVTTAPLSLGH